MMQTKARALLRDAPIMWRRINSIGIILDCNSTYAASMGYVKSEILGKSIFEHVPKESWHIMNDSLEAWFETGQVRDRRITFQRRDGTVFPGLLHATSLYDKNDNLLGSNTVIFDLMRFNDEKISEMKDYFRSSREQLYSMRETGYSRLDKNARAEHAGLEDMFEMLLGVDLTKIRDANCA